MKKAKRVEFGIEIVKPWSKAMYDHNDMVAEAVKVKVFEIWTDVYVSAMSEEFASDSDWLDEATPEMIRIQKAVTCYGFGSGYDVAKVSSIVEDEIEAAAYFRLKEIAEELDIALEQGFVGFSQPANISEKKLLKKGNPFTIFGYNIK